MTETSEIAPPVTQEVRHAQETLKGKEPQETDGEGSDVVGQATRGGATNEDNKQIAQVRKSLEELTGGQNTHKTDLNLTPRQEDLYGEKYAEIAEGRYGEGMLARHGDAAIGEIGEVPRDAVVLEVGCNTGMLLEQLKEKEIHAIGIDINQVAVEEARRRGYEVTAANAENLPFEESSINVIISLHTHEHVGDLGKAFSEIERVLVPGGKAIVIEPLNLGGLETIRVAIENMPLEKRGKGLLAFVKNFLNGIKYARKLHCSTLGGPFGGARKHAERICNENNINLDISGGVRRDLGFANLLIFKKPQASNLGL